MTGTEEMSLTQRQSEDSSTADARESFISLALWHWSRYCLASAQNSSSLSHQSSCNTQLINGAILKSEYDLWMQVPLKCSEMLRSSLSALESPCRGRKTAKVTRDGIKKLYYYSYNWINNCNFVRQCSDYSHINHVLSHSELSHFQCEHTDLEGFK